MYEKLRAEIAMMKNEIYCELRGEGLSSLRQQAGICTPFNTLFKFIMTQVARDAGGCRTRESAFSAVELSSLIFRGLCESLCALQRGKCNKLSKILESP